ncbi:MAG TPA: LuxR C-terminal-related transcriptional regulator [Anaerolineales bacterium]|nr:LuxR C-terminal-related transcriptional regulator [Anaerolineales bacterium]
MLLERQVALETLEAALVASRDGHGRVVLVCGEAGIGKTALVEHFVARLAHGARVLWGACEPFLSPRPFGPIHDFAAVAPTLERVLEDAHDGAAIQNALLAELATPTIVVIEDLHWADEATIQLLRQVSPELARCPALIILTARDDALNPQSALAPLIDWLADPNQVVRIGLAPLSATAVGDLLVGRARVERAVDAVALHRQTGGNPFFVTEVLAARDAQIPATIREAVLARAAQLSLGGRLMLQAAAVVGSRIELELLAAMIGPVEREVAEARASGMLVPLDEAIGFRHELARQAVLEAIPAPRVAQLHRSALSWLSALPEARQDVTRLAHHAMGADDPDSIWRSAPRAGRQAAWARAHQSAVAWFERALTHAAGRPDAEVAALLDDFAQECDTVDRRPEGIAARERAATLWQACGEPGRLGQTLAQQAALLQLVGRMPDALAANTRALAALEPLGPTEALISAYNTQAWLHLGNDSSEAGAEIAHRAIALAESLGLAGDLPRLTEVAGLCELYRHPEHAMALLERSLALSLGREQMTRAGNVYANLGSIAIDFHDFARATQLQAEGMALARQHELGSVYAFMEGWQAVLQVHKGDWRSAEQWLQSSLERPAPSPGRGAALLALGRLRTRRGADDPDGPLAESLTILQRQGFRQREGLVRAARAEAAYAAGNVDRVRAEVEAGWPLALRYPQPWYVGELGYWAWRIGHALTLPAWVARPYALQISGAWREAAALWEAMGCPFERARALAEGDHSARQLALTLFEALGAAPAATALSAGLGQADRPMSTQIPGLTARQSVVLGLLTDGLTNAEIASRLGLSTRTVDHHVAAILARLDVPNREEAARIARAHQAL